MGWEMCIRDRFGEASEILRELVWVVSGSLYRRRRSSGDVGVSRAIRWEDER